MEQRKQEQRFIPGNIYFSRIHCFRLFAFKAENHPENNSIFAP